MALWGTQEEGENSADTRLEQANQCEEKVQNIKTQYNLMEANLKALANALKLDILKTRQEQGSSLLNALSQQTRSFFEKGRGKNSAEDYLVQILMASINEGPLLAEIFKRQKEIRDHKDLFKIVQSIENGAKNSSRITDRGNTVRGAGTNSGREVC